MAKLETYRILDLVAQERDEQDMRFGEQNHPDLIELWQKDVRRLYQQWADEWKEANWARVMDNDLAWDSILLEEVYEALAEEDQGRLFDELIQVAAVAVAWAEAVQRRGVAR